MNAIAIKTCELLTPLSLKERQEVLEEVREYMLDVKAYERYESYKKGDTSITGFDVNYSES